MTSQRLPRWAQWVVEGLVALRKHELRTAIKKFTKALRSDRDCVAGYHGRGLAYAMKGDYDRAIRDFDRLVLLRPKAPVGYLRRGLAYDNKQDYERAVKDFDIAILLAPGDKEGYCARGYAHLNRSEWARAERDFTTVLTFDASDVPVYVWRGACRRNLGEDKYAIEDFTKALELRTQEDVHPPQRVWADMLKTDSFDAEEALLAFATFKAHDIDVAGIYFNRGLCYQSLGQIADAWRDFVQVMGRVRQHFDFNTDARAWQAAAIIVKTYEDQGIDQLLDDDPMLYGILGIAYEVGGDAHAAIESYNKAREIDPRGRAGQAATQSIKRVLKQIEGEGS